MTNAARDGTEAKRNVHFVADDGLSQPAPATVALTVFAVNDPPVANPDSYYEKNAEERRKALLNKVDALEKMLARNEHRGALEKLEQDIRARADAWFVAFPDPKSGEFTKSMVLAQIDRISARLRFLIEQSSPPPEP